MTGRKLTIPTPSITALPLKPVGGTAQLGILRGGRAQIVPVALETAPELPRDEITIRSRSPFSGAKVANLSPALADELQLDNTTHGVVIVDVDNGSYASNLGFQRGDVIQSVNGEAISRTAELERLAREAEAAPGESSSAAAARRSPRCSTGSHARQKIRARRCLPLPASTRTRRARSPTNCVRRNWTKSLARTTCSAPTAR